MTESSIANSFNIACLRLFTECERCAVAYPTIQDDIYVNRRRFSTIIGSTPLLPIKESFEYIINQSDNIVEGREQFEEYLLTVDPSSVDARAAQYPGLDELLSTVRSIIVSCPLESKQRIYALIIEIVRCAAQWAQL